MDAMSSRAQDKASSMNKMDTNIGKAIPGSPLIMLDPKSLTFQPAMSIHQIRCVTYNGIGAFGTGFAISDRHMLTAAHCVYDRYDTPPFIYKGPRKAIRLLHREKSLNPATKAFAKYADFDRAWYSVSEEEANNIDFALLYFNAGTFTSYLEMTPKVIGEPEIACYGYPDPKQARNISYLVNAGAQCTAQGKPATPIKETDPMLLFAATSCQGMSGGPVILTEGKLNSAKAIGINSLGGAPYENFNWATHLNESLVKTIEQWRTHGFGQARIHFEKL